MQYDLLIKNGFVVDGSGSPRFPADVGVKDGKIAKIGRINERASRTVNAEGQVVAPLLNRRTDEQAVDEVIYELCGMSV